MTIPDEEVLLLESWAEDLRTVVCKQCKGAGKLALASCPAVCPDCEGRGTIPTTVKGTKCQDDQM